MFERALTHVLEMEGGYDEDPYDPGGPTNLGITLGEFVRDKGIELTSDNFAAMKINNPPTFAKAEAQSTARFPTGKKWVEYFFTNFGGDALGSAEDSAQSANSQRMDTRRFMAMRAQRERNAIRRRPVRTGRLEYRPRSAARHLSRNSGRLTSPWAR